MRLFNSISAIRQTYIKFLSLQDDKYIKNNVWEYLDKNNNWVSDIKQNNLRYSIKTEVYTHFIKRVIELSDNTNDNNIMSNKLLIISSKLKEDKYISTIIKESRQFFLDE